jgi:hypothetical protein
MLLNSTLLTPVDLLLYQKEQDSSQDGITQASDCDVFELCLPPLPPYYQQPRDVQSASILSPSLQSEQSPDVPSSNPAIPMRTHLS